MDIHYRGNGLILSAQDRPAHCQSAEALDNCQTSIENNYGNTDNLYDCQKECKRTTGCKWFNWDSSTLRCYLKTDKGSSQAQVDGATGPVTGGLCGATGQYGFPHLIPNVKG